MKNIIIAVSAILVILFVLEFRYAVVVNSPIVAKVDRITGDVWIANSGVWLKVNHAARDKGIKDKAPMPQSAALSKASDKTAQTKAK